MTAIAYLQPATRAGLSRLAGREISRDVIGALKRHGLIDGALRRRSPARRSHDAFSLSDDDEGIDLNDAGCDDVAEEGYLFKPLRIGGGSRA